MEMDPAEAEPSRRKSSRLNASRSPSGTDAPCLSVALLDEHGVVLAASASWRARPHWSRAFEPGMNYLEGCRSARRSAEARIFAEALQGVLRGERDSFELEYEPRSAGKSGRYVARVAACCGPAGVRAAVTLAPLAMAGDRRAAASEHEARFRAFTEHGPLLAWLKDGSGRYVYANPLWQQRMAPDLQPGALPTDEQVVPEQKLLETRAADQAVLETDEAVELEITCPDNSGRERHWLVCKFPYADASGERLVGGLALDTTAWKEHERALRTSEARFRAALESSTDAVLLLEAVRSGTGELADFRFVAVNARAEAMAGMQREQLLGQRLVCVAPFPPCFHAMQVCKRVISAGVPIEEDLPVESSPGVTTWYRIQVNPVGFGVSITCRDISDQRWLEEQIQAQVAQVNEYSMQIQAQAIEVLEANARLEALATTDGLTGLKNHRSFQECARREFTRSRRYHTPLSILLLDVDRFKEFNDAYGHPEGDLVLQRIARSLLATARSTDLVARYGGEEFAVVMPNTDGVGALTLAERFRVAITTLRWERRPVTTSVGVATLTPAMTSVKLLIAAADRALYRSKTDGRNRVTHADWLDWPGETRSRSIAASAIAAGDDPR